MTIQGVPLAAPQPPPPPPEQLGDLKLYRVPEPVTVAAQESKQVRLLAQSKVAFTRLCTADLAAVGDTDAPSPAAVILRTRNTQANHLGLPLPSGQVAVFGPGGGRELLMGEAPLRDTAEGEEVELAMGSSPDVQVRQTQLSYQAKALETFDLTPELKLALTHGRTVEQVEITSARAEPTPFELRLQLDGAQHVTSADQPMGTKDGRPIFRLTLPANGAVTVRYAVSQ